jgi:hypothetical protein
MMTFLLLKAQEANVVLVAVASALPGPRTIIYNYTLV